MASIGMWLGVWLKVCGITAAVIGWGCLAISLVDVTSRGKSQLTRSFLLLEFGIPGFCVLYLFALVASLVTGVGPGAHSTFALVGAAGFSLAAGRWLRAERRDWFDWLVAVVLTAFTSFGAIRIPWNYDAGLYHLQALSYLHRGPLALGIANVHTRLGFNSAWFPLSALASGTVFGNDGTFLLDAAAVTIFLGAMASYGMRSRQRMSFGFAESYAAAAVLLFCASGVLFTWFGLSPSPDLPSALSCAYAFLAYLAIGEFLSTPEKREKAENELGKLLLLMVLSVVFAVTTKGSQLPVFMLVLLLFSLGTRRLQDRSEGGLRRAVVFGGVMIVGWITQGVLTSGCLAFPVGKSCLTFLPWAVEPAKADLAKLQITGWARAPSTPYDQIPAGFGWLPIWRDRMLRYREFAFTLVWIAAGLQALGLIALACTRWAKRGSPKPIPAEIAKVLLLMFAVALAGLLYWFFDAPDPRFGLGFLVAAPSLVFSAIAGRALRHDGSARFRAMVPSVLSALVLLAMLVQAYRLHLDQPSYVWRHVPEPTVRSLVSPAGVKVKAPVAGDQCWDVAPPCTPEGISSLHQSSLLGHVMYSHSGPAGPPVAELPRDPTFPVAFGPKTWGEEAVTYAGKPHSVRWLQTETELIVFNDSQSAQPVVISLDIATFRRPRHVRLLINGEPVPDSRLITHDFWAAGPETVQYPATLRTGRNQLVLKSDDPMDMLPGNRAASFLLLDNVRVARQK